MIPVHLYGQIAPMGEILSVTAGSELAVIEDAAQAQGAEQDGQGIGSWGTAAATSFYRARTSAPTVTPVPC